MAIEYWRRIMLFGRQQTTLRMDLMELARDKLKDLGDFPVNITPELKHRITNLQEEFLELRQTKKFTEERGVAILREVDEINKALAELPRKNPMEIEDRKRKQMKPKSKRKIVKKRK